MKRLLLLLLVAGCATAPATQTATGPATSPVAAVASDPAAAEQLAALETRLNALDRLFIRFNVETSGAVQLIGRGPMRWIEDNIELNPAGSMATEQKTVHFLEPDTPELRSAVVAGWVRMGMTHNVYRLYTGEKVDLNMAAVQTANVRFDPAERKFTFDVLANGTDVADAQLWLLPNGLPLRREQTVRFPNGEMKVIEGYQWFF